MSNNRNFPGVRFETQGRTVNLAANMLKRSSISFNSSSQIHQQSPFANYNCKINESNATQSSCLQEEKLNQDIMRQIAKQEISKIPKQQDLTKKVVATLQAQINDLKQKIIQNGKENNKKMQDMSVGMIQDIRAEAQKVGKEVENEISTKLRLFFQKVNAELKKDILQNVGQEYLSMSYGEEFENRLQNINEKIQTMNNLILTKELSSEILEKKAMSVNSNQHLQLKFSKVEKETQYSKKMLGDISNQLKVLQEQKIKFQIEVFQKKIKQIEQQSQRKYFKSNSQILSKVNQNERCLQLMKEQISQLQRKLDEQRYVFLDFQKKMSSKKQSEQTISCLKNEPLQASLLFNQNLNPSIINQFSSFEDSIEKSLYQVDKEGYLMDGSGKYLLTQSNTMVKLTNDQISTLIESRAVEIIDK